MHKRPSAALAHDEPRLDIVARGEVGGFPPGQEALESVNGPTNQQRSLLPVTSEEARRGGAAQKRTFHRAIIAGTRWRAPAEGPVARLRYNICDRRAGARRIQRSLTEPPIPRIEPCKFHPTLSSC